MSSGGLPLPRPRAGARSPSLLGLRSGAARDALHGGGPVRLLVAPERTVRCHHIDLASVPHVVPSECSFSTINSGSMNLFIPF